MVRLEEVRRGRVRDREQVLAEIGAESAGAHGGKGASDRGRWAVKRARWASKRQGATQGGVGKKGRWLTCVERQVAVPTEGIPTPEVLKALRQQERAQEIKRKGLSHPKFAVHSDQARRMLALLRLQARRRARERDKGRIRLRLFD